MPPTSSDTDYKCHRCDKSCLTKAGLTKHMQTCIKDLGKKDIKKKKSKT